jgi:hypothetical protein
MERRPAWRPQGLKPTIVNDLDGAADAAPLQGQSLKQESSMFKVESLYALACCG